jgi:hypothetical protein
VHFLDVVDSSIMNVALPSIRRDLGGARLAQRARRQPCQRRRRPQPSPSAGTGRLTPPAPLEQESQQP